MFSSPGSDNGFPAAVLWLCALTLPLAGCSAAADATSAPAPATPGALVTDSWFYDSQGALVEVPGTWVHVPAAEAGELELWIEQAEEAAWN